MKTGLKLRPVSLRQANAMVEQFHRHHKPSRGCRFCLSAWDGEKLVGVAIVGRPVARALDQWKTAEVVRCCTDGSKNACSFLYGACARVAKEMGFDLIQTYILVSEPGTSLKASGWTCDGQVRKDGKGWNNRPNRKTDQPVEPKVRWRKVFKNDLDQPKQDV